MPDGKMWEVYIRPSGAHVMPENDLIEHVIDEDCVCGPRTTAVVRKDGSNGWMYTHASLDNREAKE